MNKIKRYVGILLVILLCFAPVLPVLADEAGDETKQNSVIVETEQQSSETDFAKNPDTSELQKEDVQNPEVVSENDAEEIAEENTEATEASGPEIVTDDVEEGIVQTNPSGTLPVVRFHIDEQQGSIEAMNASEDHSVNCYGTVDIEVPAGYKSEYTGAEESSHMNLPLEYIRGRGNSTWMEDKKPYKFKLDKGKDLFGMGKSKHWVLLANYFDNSLVRNRTTYWLGAELGMAFTPQCVPVEVVMNDVYLGTYLLAEQIRVDKYRIEIDELEDTDVEEPEITGGYLVAMEPNNAREEESLFTTDNGVKLVNDSPDFAEDGNDAQKAYIRDYIQKMENAILGDDHKDENGVSYQEYMDLASAVDYWWMQEISMNGDAFVTSSSYFYKKRNGKIFWGPLWDFDFAWGDCDYDEDRVSGFNNAISLWFDALKADEDFVQAVKDRWPAIDAKLEEITKQGGLLDRYYNELKDAEALDTALWGRYESDLTDYAEEIEDFRNWIIDRRAWINANLDQLDNLAATVQAFDEEGNLLFKRTVGRGNFLDAKQPEKEGYTFMGWKLEDGTAIDLESEPILHDMVIVADLRKTDELIKPEEIYFADDYVVVNVMVGMYAPNYSLYPSEYDLPMITWKVSNSDVAVVGDAGNLYVFAEGDFTLSATLADGSTKSIHVRGVKEGIDSYKITNLAYAGDTEMQVGDRTQVLPTRSPEYAYMRYQFSTGNAAIATVDNAGVVTAIDVGETVLTVKDEVTGLEATCKIIVTDGKAVAGKYSFAGVGKFTWKKGSNEGLLFVGEREGDSAGTFAHFVGVEADGEAVDSKNYEAKNGSVRLTLLPAYLEALSVGEHQIALLFDDGRLEGTFTVQEKDKESNTDDGKKDDQNKDQKNVTPSSGDKGNNAGNNAGKSSNKEKAVKTGDTMPITLLRVCMAFSVVCMGFCIWKKRNRNLTENTNGK